MALKNREAAEKWKFWTLVVTAGVSIYASTISTFINSNGAKEASLKELVRQVNEVVLPDIQKELELLREDNIKIRERLAGMEIYRDLIREMQKEFRLPVTGGKGKENREAQEASALKLAPPPEMFHKKPLKRLDISSYAVDAPTEEPTGY